MQPFQYNREPKEIRYGMFALGILEEGQLCPNSAFEEEEMHLSFTTAVMC